MFENNLLLSLMVLLVDGAQLGTVAQHIHVVAAR